MRRRRKNLKPREERMRRRRKILKPRAKELKIYGGFEINSLVLTNIKMRMVGDG